MKKNEKGKMAGKSALNALEAYPVRMVFAACFSVLVFTVYLITLSPSVGTGADSGELTAVAYTLGVAHPPGYPLFTLLGKLFTLIPIGTIGWRVNLLSALMSALASFFLCIGIQKWTRNVLAGFLGAGIFFFSPVVWANSVVAEVFSLNNFFVCLLFYLSIRYRETLARRFLYIAAFAFGLGLSNHHTLVIVGIPLGIWFLLQDRKNNLRPLEILAIFIIVLLGFLPYIYIPIAAQRVPVMSWGSAYTWDGFWAHFFRTEYGTFSLSNEQVGQAGIFERLWAYFGLVPSETLYVVWLAGIAGIVYMFMNGRWKSLGGLWLGIGVLYLIVFCGLSNLNLSSAFLLKIQSRFYQVPGLILAMMISYAFACWGHYLKKAAIAVVAVIVLAQVIVNYKAQDQSGNTVLIDYSKSVLDSMPGDSVLIIYGDYNFGGLYYAQTCEHFRSDVKVLHMAYLSRIWSRRWVEANFKTINLPEYGVLSSGGYKLYDLIYANQGEHDIFTTGGIPGWDASYQDKTGLWQWGLIIKFLPWGAEPNLEEWIKLNEREFERIDRQSLWRFAPGSLEHSIFTVYLSSRHSFAGEAINTGAVTGQISPLALYEAGARNLLAIESHYSKDHPEFYKDIGLAYIRMADFDPAKKTDGLLYWKRYLDSNPPEDDEVRFIRNYVNQ